MNPEPITEAEAATWAAEKGLGFPQLAAWAQDDPPRWEWYDGGEGRYLGYLPQDWDRVPDDSHKAPLLYDHELYGIQDEYYDLALCTIVVHVNYNTGARDSYAIAHLPDENAAMRWEADDGRFEDEAVEIINYFAPVFDEFDPFVPATAALMTQSPLVAEADGWAERRGPYSEYGLRLHDLGDGTFLAVGTEPGGRPEYQRVFATLDAAAEWIQEAAELLGTDPEVDPGWEDRWPF